MIGRKGIILIFAAVFLLAALSGCGRSGAVSESANIVPDPAPAAQAGSAGAPQTEAAPGRQAGERFESVIMIEGMEETIRCEHIRNDAIGFEMDYDYERFERRSEPGRERFVSVYDLSAAPENYLEVTYSAADAETAAASIGAALSAEYEISRDDAFQLDRTGRCIRIDASAEKGGERMPEHLQTVYIFPAADGCRVAAAHYSIEGADGFGKRFRNMMDSFSVIDAQGQGRLTDAQALSAIRQYCCLQNPELAGYAETGELPVYWDIASSGADEIVVVFRSYTGALIRYYIDPVSGDTCVTEQVPGILDEEQRTDERLNVRDYLNESGA